MNDRRIFAQEELNRQKAKGLNKEIQALKRYKGVFERRKQTELAKEYEEKIREKLEELKKVNDAGTRCRLTNIRRG